MRSRRAVASQGRLEPWRDGVRSGLERLAAAVESGRPDAEVRAACDALRALCGDPPAHAVSLAEDLAWRAATWMDVWPRLCADAAFRAAVVREARAQARQFPRVRERH